MNIGTQIQTLRKKQGITQETLAAEMGVTVGAVSKWENGITLPDILMLCSLADYFRVSTDELLGRMNQKTFMVCDDAPFIRNTLHEMLEKEGYHCTGLAENAEQLNNLLEKNIPDILFLDIHLGTENGLDLLQEIKEKHLSTKIIMVTADNTQEATQSAVSNGADAYITKPFLPEHIRIALNRL
ncbi:MAG: response regulator [Lachnospiraceae bacterium]|nr:response regulator [Lachnospiraceae bacterium]